VQDWIDIASHDDAQRFIIENEHIDVNTLVLKGKELFGLSPNVLAQQISSRRKIRKKLPSFYNTQGIVYPPVLNLEQTSSEKTALFKSGLFTGNKMIDLTGGFGIDCWAFSQSFEEVVHCEQNEVLSDIASQALKKLGKTNIVLEKGTSDQILNRVEGLDLIYVDPGRRHDSKGKVFRLEDCAPNVLDHIDLYLRKSDRILLKLSPMIDVNYVLETLPSIKHIWSISVKNETKEILVLIDQSSSEEIKFTAVDLGEKESVFEVDRSQTETCFSGVKKYIFEPYSSLMKLEGFRSLSSQLNISKLGAHAHLFTSDDIIEFPGKKFEVIKTEKFNKGQLKKQLKDQNFSIVTKAFPLKAEEIRKQFKVKESVSDYLFFYTNNAKEKMVIFAKLII